MRVAGFAALGLSALVLTGCAALMLMRPPDPESPAAIAMESEQKMRQESTLRLCAAYGVYRQAAVRDELMQRNALPPEEWALADGQKIRVGMSLCGLFAAWGNAWQVNRRVAAAGATTEFIYPSRTVFVEDGKIASFVTTD